MQVILYAYLTFHIHSLEVMKRCDWLNGTFCVSHGRVSQRSHMLLFLPPDLLSKKHI